MTAPSLQRTRALWNRTVCDLENDEVVAQILDRGELDAWRALYRVARRDVRLRRRILTIVREVPLPLPHFWLAALAALGEPVDFETPLPEYGSDSV